MKVECRVAADPKLEKIGNLTFYDDPKLKKMDNFTFFANNKIWDISLSNVNIFGLLINPYIKYNQR